jgi:hypothetical protein
MRWPSGEAFLSLVGEGYQQQLYNTSATNAVIPAKKKCYRRRRALV